MRLRALIALAGAGLFAACHTNDAPAEQILHISLNDSLARYDSVTVVLVDAVDTAQVLEQIWKGPLAQPSKLPPDTLSTARDKNFAVKILGYAGDGQVALETLIFYEGGQKRVVHQPLPQVIPKRWISRLAPSAGSLSPSLDQDSLEYRLSLPEGITRVTLDVVPAHARAVLTVSGDTIRFGSPPKQLAVGNKSDTVWISVSELGVARNYHVILIPHSPVDVQLADIAVDTPSVLDYEFDKDQQQYTVLVPAKLDTATIRFFPADPQTMSMTVKDNGQNHSLIPGGGWTARIAKDSLEHVFSLVIRRDTVTQEYTILVDRLNASPSP